MRTFLLALLICSLCPLLLAQEAPGVDAKIVRRDGATVTGRVDKVTITSASLGEVTVGGAKIDKIAFAAFRPFDDAARREAERLIPEIGDDDPAKREAATEKIRRMGPGVLPLLKALSTTDPEVKFRITGIIEALETPKGRSCDTVEGEDFFLDGTITSLIVDGKPLDLREVKSIDLNPPPGANDVVGAWTLDIDALLEEMRKNPNYKADDPMVKQMEEQIKKTKVTVVINADNSFTGSAEGVGNKSTGKGTWKLEGEKLTMCTTEEDGKPKNPPEINGLIFKDGIITHEEGGMKIPLKRK